MYLFDQSKTIYQQIKFAQWPTIAKKNPLDFIVTFPVSQNSKCAKKWQFNY